MKTIYSLANFLSNKIRTRPEVCSESFPVNYRLFISPSINGEPFLQFHSLILYSTALLPMYTVTVYRPRILLFQEVRQIDLQTNGKVKWLMAFQWRIRFITPRGLFYTFPCLLIDGHWTGLLSE